MTHYKITALTPLLIGDGNRLSPIDYMVWKDQVNVLDQRKIFRLLAKSPRLDSYLTQIRRAEKLDFNSWGGYAQNYALRRIPLESPALARVFERALPEHLFLPTFATAPAGGIYIPATAVKGVLRTALLADRVNPSHWNQLAEKLESAERTPRSPGEILESASLGAAGQQRTRGLLVSDSTPRHAGGITKIYLTRTATLTERNGRVEIGWKTAPRGTLEGRRAADATPVLAEMAIPGTVFEGVVSEPELFRQPATLRSLNWR
ncbi:MAG: RAMP superfamily CRISPR-associated protein, partial [Bryobacter sp.]|nr:RAMP superfamily CRISPR-associated protein [Bryobacter sp.]